VVLGVGVEEGDRSGRKVRPSFLSFDRSSSLLSPSSEFEADADGVGDVPGRIEDRDAWRFADVRTATASAPTVSPSANTTPTPSPTR
jgi:hypothetical protein